MSTQGHRRSLGADDTLLERNPKVRELMKLWNPKILQKTGRILLPNHVSDERDREVNWLLVYWSQRGRGRS